MADERIAALEAERDLAISRGQVRTTRVPPSPSPSHRPLTCTSLLRLLSRRKAELRGKIKDLTERFQASAHEAQRAVRDAVTQERCAS